MPQPKSLDAHLEQVRSHLEAQLQAVDAITKLVRELDSLSALQQAAHIVRVHTDLHEIDRAGEMLSFLARQARQALDQRARPPE